jgi:hypothetical protein
MSKYETYKAAFQAVRRARNAEGLFLNRHLRVLFAASAPARAEGVGTPAGVGATRGGDGSAKEGSTL